MLPNWQNLFKKIINYKWWLIGGASLVVVLAALFIWQPNLFKAKKAPYANNYALVNDKVSQGASIVINVPPFLKKAEMNVRFQPEIKGDWVATTDEKKIAFKPSEPLVKGHFYLAIASSPKGNLSKDFEIVDEPKLVSVLPGEDAEAPLKSKITFVFNRPIVPLSDLQTMEQVPAQIEIKPATPGKYKWISTRTLQFVPDDGLVGSANYTVSLKDGLVSQDGLTVPALENKFTTLNLRYAGSDTAKVVYNEALRMRFNQNVDLAKTEKNIKLNNITANVETKFIAQYGKKTITQDGKEEEVEDKSVIELYNKEDRYGRERMWDFNNDYEASISEVYPEFGDINLSGGLKISYTSSDVLSNLVVESPRSSNASADMFDPQGKIHLYFFEDINLDKSKITADKLLKIEYGRKCLAADNEYGEGFNCEQIDDKAHLVLTFDQTKLKIGEVFNLNFAKLVNASGQTVNHDNFSRTIAVYKPLEVASQNLFNADKVDPSSLYVCTNNPLASAPGNELTVKQSADFLQSDNEAQLVTWSYSSLSYGNDNDYCLAGKYQTLFTWALMPNSNYKIQLKVIDEFGQNALLKLNFKSGDLPKASLNFFHYQKGNSGYNVTTPGKTELTYAAVNMDYVDINFCKLSAEDMLYYITNPVGSSKGPGVIKGCLKTVNKKLALPKRYWLKNYFKINLKDYVGEGTGHWIVTFSNPDYVNEDRDYLDQIFERTYITVTNLSLVGKWVEVSEDLTDKTIKNLFWVTKLNDLSPVSGVTVWLWNNKQNENGFGKTDGTGLAQIAANNNLMGATVEVGGDSALLTNNYDSNFNTGGTAYNSQAAYIYTDRPMYRPGQTINFKVIWRAGYDGNYDFVENKVLKVTARGSGTDVYEKELKLNAFGTLADSFVLPADAPLGNYNIQTDNGGYYSFDVEDYVAAGFKVDAKTDKEEYLSGEQITLNLAASYYFGAPLEGGTVEYSLGSQNYYFDKYQDEYFSFGSSWYYCPDCGYGDRFVLRGKANLDNQGKVQISQNFDINKLFKEGEKNSKVVNFYYTIVNTNGQSISGVQSIIVHAGQFYVGLNSSKDFVGKQEKFQLKAKTVDINGKPLAVNNLKLEVNRINWVESKRQEVDGSYYYGYDRQVEKVKEEKIDTDRNGNWANEMALDKEGEYEIVLSGTDSGNRNVQVKYDMYVYGEAQVEVQQTNDQKLEITTDKSSLRAGDTGKILIKSPYNKAKALVTVERGKVYTYKVIDINQNLVQYEFPVTDAYAPQVYVSVVLISNKPDVKYGSLPFSVNTYKNDLKVSVKANKDHYLPGEKVDLKIEARDAGNTPVQAELSIAVADLSVLALVGNPKKTPAAWFYDYFPLNVSSGSNLKDLMKTVEIPTGGKGGDGANSPGLDKKKRGEFRDTAFWSAQVVTDANGQATASFVLPDNLTTWQIESLGLTKDLKLGVNYLEFIARKDLMAVPLKPRFIVAGDEFMVGAKIVNQTSGKQTIKIDLTSDSLSLADKEKTISLNAGEITNVYFRVKAPLEKNSGQHKFTIAAIANGGSEDTVESVIPIVAPTTYETVATSGYSDAAIINEYFYLPANIYSKYSQLKVNSSATLAVYLNSALNYLAGYPYGCGEQISSKLRALAVIKQGLNSAPESSAYKVEKILGPDGVEYTLDEAIKIGLAKLMEDYKQGEGFSYYPGGEPSFYVSLAVAKAMVELKAAGIVVDEVILADLKTIIENRILEEGTYKKLDTSSVVFAAQVLVSLDQKLSEPVLVKLQKIASDKKYLVDKAGNLEIIALADIATSNPIIKKVVAQNLTQLLDNRIEVDSRGAFLKPTSNWSWYNYEDDVNDTAQYLSLIVKNKQTHALNDSLWRWLLMSRDRDGAWGSTNNTMAVVKAMSAYLDWKQEAKSDFKLDIVLNDKIKETRNYKPANILEQNSTTWYGNDFKVGELNTIGFSKMNNNILTNGFYYDMAFKYYVPAETIGPKDEGFVVSRGFYSQEDENRTNPLQVAKVGDVLKARLEIVVGENRHNVSIESFIPAGFELVNFNLATENSALRQESEDNYYDSEMYLWSDSQQAENFWPDKAELRDDRVFLFRENVQPGTYYYEYYVRALVPGKFNHLPAIAQEMYFPENFGRSAGEYFEVKQ